MCVVDGCVEKQIHAKGYCRKHYQRNKAHLEIVGVSKCEACPKTFPHKIRKRYCSRACRSTARAAEYRERHSKPRLDTATVGSLSELTAAIDLTRRGYAVYRAISPSAPCDLIATKGNAVLRVEVRTGTVNTSGSVSFPRPTRDSGRSDVYAVVVGDAVSYHPDLPSEVVCAAPGAA